MRRRTCCVAVAMVTLVMVATGCVGGSSNASGTTSLTFMAGFSAQANLPFVGVYVAQELGYFADEGLEVEIQHSAGEHLQLLAAGEVDVTTQDAAVLLQRRADPGLPIVSIGLIGQVGQQAYVALAESGIDTPEDWVGRSVGYKGTPPPDVFAILDAHDLDPSDVDLVNVGFDPRVLTEGQVDVYPVFKSNEPDTLASMGFELTMWDAADYGIPTLGLAYVATEEMVDSRPEELAAFLRAALRGIERATSEPEEAVGIVLEYMGDDADAAHQRFILDTELHDSVSDVTEGNGLGWQAVEQWQALHDLLIEYEAIEEPINVDAAFTTDLLP